ncbi:MAG TPA: hypothetical protein VFD42_04080, partial [Chloroflexota bacterium]|nr:hypothetical protein [Chloroflexota bacterium]
LIGTPYAVLDFPNFRGGFMSQLEMGSAAWSGQSAAATAWVFLAGLVHGAGFVAALGGVAGILLLLRADRRAALLLLAFPVTYFAFMASMDLFFVRWVVPVMPFVALAGAYALERLFRWSPVYRAPVLGVALVTITLIQPAASSLRLDWLVQRMDTRIEANRWAELNIPPGSKVAVEAFSLLDQEALSFRATLQQREIELVWRATMQPMEYYLGEGFDYLAVSSFMYDRAFENQEGYRDRVDFYQRLDREYPLVATFSPRTDGGAPGFALDDTDTPFWRLWDYDRPGPTIKVYRLRS